MFLDVFLSLTANVQHPMFVENNVLDFEALFRKCIYDFRSRLFTSLNSILTSLCLNFYVTSNDLFRSLVCLNDHLVLWKFYILK